jgi:hypothetical protein
VTKALTHIVIVVCFDELCTGTLNYAQNALLTDTLLTNVSYITVSYITVSYSGVASNPLGKKLEGLGATV